jgi:HKD family nuclease
VCQAAEWNLKEDETFSGYGIKKVTSEKNQLLTLANTEVDAHSQLMNGWITGLPMEELEKVAKELKGSATL